MAIVHTFSNEIEAEMAMSALEAAGISAAMTRDDCGGIYPSMGLTAGVQVVVDDEHLGAAQEVLDAFSATITELPPDAGD